MRHLILGILGCLLFSFGLILLIHGLAWACGVELSENGRVCLLIFATAAAFGGAAAGAAAAEVNP